MNYLDSTRFYGNKTLTQIIRENVIGMLRYGLLEVGAFYNIPIGTTDANGNDLSRYRPVSYPGQSGIRVFQGFKADAVWEQGINLDYASGAQPLSITGIRVNDVVVPTGTSISGTISYYLDYPKNRVVFSAALPSGTKVQVPHTVRAVSVYDAGGDVYRKLTSDWVNSPSGTSNGAQYSIEEKIYLPALFVRVDGFGNSAGFELGSRTKISEAKITIDALSVDDFSIERLQDMCFALESRFVTFYDIDSAPRPYNQNGALSTGALTYPQLITQYPETGWARFMENANTRPIKTNLPAKMSRTTISLEIPIAPI